MNPAVHPDVGSQVPSALVGHVDTSGPRAVVSGTDIKVSQIASEVDRLGMTPDEVVAAHPHLTLADVYGALTFYCDNPEVIRAEWKEAEELIESLQVRFPPGSSGALRR